jgi:hypothetical protein
VEDDRPGDRVLTGADDASPDLGRLDSNGEKGK